MEVLSNGLPAKLLMLLLTVVMSTNMSGCRETADAADTSQPPGVVAEQTDAKISSSKVSNKLQYPEPQPIPEDGWTYETLNERIWVNGNYISLPCKFSDLGAGFDVSTENRFFQYGDDKFEVGLLYKGKNIGNINVSCKDSDYKSSIVEGFTVFYIDNVEDAEYPVAINGVTIGSEISLAEKFIGTSEMNNLYYFSKDFDYNGKTYTYCVCNTFPDTPKITFIAYIIKQEA